MRVTVKRNGAHRLDVPVQEAHRVDALNSLQDLPAEPERGGQRKRTVAHGAPKVSQVPSLWSEVIQTVSHPTGFQPSTSCLV